MYSRMDLGTGNERCDAKSKKKYELSLRRGRHATLPDPSYSDYKYEGEAMPGILRNRNETADSSDSQNFMLQVSDSFVVEDTQENNNKIKLPARKSIEHEVILISDSSEDETAAKYEWARLKTSALMKDSRRKSVSPPSTILTIESSDSENDGLRKRQGSGGAAGNATNFLSAREPLRKRSVTYTSDETGSDTESGNVSNDKENFFKFRVDRAAAKNIISDSDDSIFSFDKMRGVLTENGRNIDGSTSAKCLNESNERNQDFRRTPIYDKIGRDTTESTKSLKETKRRIEERRRTPDIPKVSKNETGSLTNLKESNKKIVESRPAPEFPGFSKNKSGSLNNLRGTNGKIEVSQGTPEFESISKKDTGSLNNLKETNKRMEEFRKTPDFVKISRIETGSLNKLKETNRRIEESRQTPELERILNGETGSLRRLQETSRKIEEPRRTPISAKISSSTTILSNKDVRNILKVIRSKRAVFESPREYKNPIIHSDDSEDNEDKVLSPESNVVSRKKTVIAETDSDSEDKIIRGSRIDLSKPYKTHVTRFLDPSVINSDSPDGMSEKKKLEIAHWLMTNPSDGRSESSISNVSASNKTSPSSGNSSLERLEMNYETPNNRERIRKANNDERAKSNRTHSTKSTKLRQTTIDNFVRRGRDDGTTKMSTPASVTTRKIDSSAKKETTENLEITDCADILDNLYGKAWRSRANDLLPLTEPRKKNIVFRDKGVQTERKINPRSKRVTKSSDSSSQEDEFDKFVKNMNPNLNSTKKPVAKSNYRRCNFIKDSSSSPDSCAETTYLTALTNPPISNNYKTSHPTPLSLNVRRAIAICDSDTEEDEDDKRRDNRKALSFSDDKSDSSTSEYDPNDVIPPKTTTKSRGASTNPKNATKITTKIPISVANAKITKPRSSFLASLSATIPLIEAHPDAKKYRQDYKNTKEELCKYLYKLFNEKIFDNKLPSDMTIEWNVRMRGTAGFCYNKRSVKALGGVTRSSRIVLATKILDTPDRLRDTLVHEMCHAAAWLINDVSDGHGPFWKGWVAKVMKAFPELPPIKRCHDYKITTKYTYRCTGCGYSVGRHSKSLDVERKRCGHCYGKFELLINKLTKSGKIELKTPVTKKPTGFALFVKENYSSVKKERKGVPHKQVMQILGQQFSAIKITKNNDNFDENNPVNVSND